MSRWLRASAGLLLALWGVAADQTTWRAGAAPEQAAVRAPRRLADSGLYAPGRGDIIDPRNRAFSPQYPLWSDGAAKSRWVYLPPGATIDARDPDAWEVPVGTRFWKEFRFGGRKVETRLLWRVSRARWIAVSYAWNAEGTDAVLAPEHGVTAVAEVAQGRRHSIPSASDCLACHGAPRTRPLGFTALQLSPDRDPKAIHGEPLGGGMVSLETLHAEGRLTPARTDPSARPPRITASDPLARAALGYLVANCGSCHSREGDVPAVAPFLPIRDLLTDADAVAHAMARRTTAWQAPARADGGTRLVDLSSPDLSALLLRMRSRRPSSQMPPLGTVLADAAAVQEIERWIAGVAVSAAVHTSTAR